VLRGCQCFEGMKAYIDPSGKVRLFRPDMNMKRLNRSMKRLLLPEFDGDELTECLKCVI
jgi:branched-chain amino acid aminotransferase